MSTKNITLIVILVILAGLVIYMVSARVSGPNMPGQPAPHAIDQSPTTTAPPATPAEPAPAAPAPTTPAPTTPAPTTPAPATPDTTPTTPAPTTPAPATPQAP